MNEEPLSNFIKYKNAIDDLSLDNSCMSMNSDISNIVSSLSASDFNKKLLSELEECSDGVSLELNKFREILQQYKNSATDYITTNESSYLSKSYQIYEDGNTQDNADYILDRALFHSLIYRNEIKNYFISRIISNSKWKYSGMFIRPEHGEYVNEMTATDPLYIVDEHIGLLEPTKKLWNEQYQERIRYHIIDESRNIIFKDFPMGNMGLVVAMNFFNHKPLVIIEQYLSEIYDLLQYGGVMIFTYNNCNLSLAVQNFEKSLYSYTPESRLIPLIEMIGFEVIETYNEPLTNVSWVEIKKPGKLSSIRGGQCLAEIHI
jgi:SAM-dependent methyltransferase